MKFPHHRCRKVSEWAHPANNLLAALVAGFLKRNFASAKFLFKNCSPGGPPTKAGRYAELGAGLRAGLPWLHDPIRHPLWHSYAAFPVLSVQPRPVRLGSNHNKQKSHPVSDGSCFKDVIGYFTFSSCLILSTVETGTSSIEAIFSTENSKYWPVPTEPTDFSLLRPLPFSPLPWRPGVSILPPVQKYP